MSRKIIIVLTAIVAVLATMSPAHAGRINDANDRPERYDIDQVRVQRNSNGWYYTAIYGNGFNAGRGFNALEVRYDSRGNRAYDYRLVWAWTGDGDRYKLFGLFTRGGRRVSCDYRFRSRDWPWAQMYVDRRCLRATKRVGVKVIAWDYTRYRGGRPVRGYTDVAPNRGYHRA